MNASENRTRCGKVTRNRTDETGNECTIFRESSGVRSHGCDSNIHNPPRGWIKDSGGCASQTFWSIEVTEFDAPPTTPKSQSHHPFGFPSPTLRPPRNRSYFSQCLVYLLVVRECNDDYFQAPQAVRRCRGSVIANHSSFVDQFLVNVEFSRVCDRLRPNVDNAVRSLFPHTRNLLAHQENLLILY